MILLLAFLTGCMHTGGYVAVKGLPDDATRQIVGARMATAPVAVCQARMSGEIIMTDSVQTRVKLDKHGVETKVAVGAGCNAR